MDTIRKQLIDDQRAVDIFARVRSRLASERIKTNEKYIDLLIDEINKYFIDISTSTIDSNDLPADNQGPISDKHNKLISNILTDIDKVHGKRQEVQDLMTKAFNYLSTERVSINNAVSKVQSRVTNQKLRSSVNDRNLTIFNEYFTDSNFMDQSLSSNVSVDTNISALTLQPISIKNDNSNLIEPSSIVVQVKLRAEAGASDSVYPLSESIKNNNYTTGFGRSISDDLLNTMKVNSYCAGYTSSHVDPNQFMPIQQQCLQLGSNGGIDSATHGEFELVFNHFKGSKIISSIQNAIRQASKDENHTDIDTNHIIISETTGFSFNYAKDDSSSSISTDPKDVFNTIESMGLRFDLKEGTISSSLSYINIHFQTTPDTQTIPSIDYTKSYIHDSNGKDWFCFKEMALNNNTNNVNESKALLLDQPVSNPIYFYIAFDLTSLTPSMINKYTGVCWKVFLNGSNGVTGSTVYPDGSIKQVTAGATRCLYIYHDAQRSSNQSEVKSLNKNFLDSIISQYRTSVTAQSSSNISSIL